MSTRTLLMRRTVLQTAAAATTLAAPFVRGAHAAGKLSVFKKDLTGLLVVDPYNDFSPYPASAGCATAAGSRLAPPGRVPVLS